MARRKAGDGKVRVGNVSRVSGKVTIAGGDIYEGYTVEQVSLLLKEITTNYRRKPFDGRCPYKGLDVFEEEDADLFFGRERLVEDLLKRIKESRTVFITGPSGSGKSSLVRAGLIHALKQGGIKRSEHWLYETLKPGREPIKELSLAFSRLRGPDLTDYFLAHANETDVLNKCAEAVLSGQKTQRFVLFIDQFEEVFTQINGEEERQAFINMLAHAGTVENGRVIVLFAMRSDFVSNCATYPALNELLSQEFRQIGAMQPEELVAAIALPAIHVGLPIEDDLIARIINDMKGEPGALPLMQFALKDLFDSQQARGGVITLTLEDYLRHGGIQKSLERHADASLAALDEKSQNLARSIFSGLIEIGRGTADTKRTALFDELVPANTKAEEVLTIVQKLADARLIITDEQAGKDTVTISHEKLIEAWPWLKKLVDENRGAIALQNEIANEAKEWDDHRRDPSYLYSGVRLANAQEQLSANKLVLSGTANEFLQAGIFRKQREQRTRVLSIAGIIALVIAGILFFSYINITNSNNLAEQSKKSEKTQAALASTSDAMAVAAQANADEAQTQRDIARAGELAAQSVAMREKNFRVSLLLSIEAFRAFDTPPTRGNLLDAVRTNPRLLQSLSGLAGSVQSLAFSPDGKTLASGCADGNIILWDVNTHQPIGEPLQHAGSVSSVAFSPDGTMLVTGSNLRIPHYEGSSRYVITISTIILWNVDTHQRIGEPLQHDDKLRTVVFSPDGKTLASGYDNSTIILWDVNKHQSIGEPLQGPGVHLLSVAFSPDGTKLASGGGAFITLWDVDTHQPIGEPLLEPVNWISTIAFSPDGTKLASSGDESNGNEGIITLWDINTHQPIDEPLQGHTDSAVSSVAFSPDGKTLASGSNDQTVILWDVNTHKPIGKPLQGHTDSVSSVAFSPDDAILASGSDDGTIILWDTNAHQPIGEPLQGLTSSVSSVAFSPDGNTLASGNSDKTITLWDTNAHQPIGEPLQGHTDSISSVVFNPAGKTLASGSDDGTIILWDVSTHQRIGEPLQGPGLHYLSVAFSPDGTKLASGSDDGTILWDVNTHQRIGEPLPEQSGFVLSVAFSPDGTILASGGVGTIILWDVNSHQPIGEPLQHTGSVSSLVFSPDGTKLASVGNDLTSLGAESTIILWDVDTRQPIGAPLHQAALHPGYPGFVVFSPDGTILASTSDDGTIILWDANSHQRIGAPLEGSTGFVWSAAFSPDGTKLASGSDDGIILWDMDAHSWLEESCQRSGRNFTRDEWAQYFPNQEYRKTCEQWPKHVSYYRALADELLLAPLDVQQVQNALANLRSEMEKDSSIKDWAFESSRIIGEVVTRKLLLEEYTGRWKEVLSVLDYAKDNHLPLDQLLNDTIFSETSFLNKLCRDGSLEGYAEQALEYCERAVALTPDDPAIRDSRGLARALTGDFEGAILDFQYFVEYSTDSGHIAERKHWIEELKMGKNPFTSKVLEALKNE